jgi:MinD-like ATPase involved in chromosome partitioning or flagellar assembly
MEMTELFPKAHAIMEAYYNIDTTEEEGIVALLREVVNQLQQSPGVLMCYDILELCDELEAL